MRLILLLTVLFSQLNLIAQAVIGKFDVIVSEDDFSILTGKWEQRFSLTDFYITENGKYIVKNKSEQSFATSLHTPELNLSKYEVSASLKTDATKKTELSIGIMINARADGSGAIVCELNSKNQYRIRTFLNGQWDIVSHTGNNGWTSTKALVSKSFNELMIRCDNGVFDLWINSNFIVSFTDKNLRSGNVGVFISALGSGSIDHFKIMQEGMPFLPPPLTPENFDTLKDNSLPKTVLSENEVVLLLKGKIDKQQKKINALTNDLERCKRQKSGDTTIELKHAELEKYNESVLIEKGKIEIALRNATDKLAEYELLKKSLENDNNGDLILSLNELLNREKLKNSDLQQKINVLKSENKKLLDSLKTPQNTKK